MEVQVPLMPSVIRAVARNERTHFLNTTVAISNLECHRMTIKYLQYFVFLYS